MKLLWICIPLFLFFSPLIIDGKEKYQPDKLEKKIGQMIMVGFRGTELPPHHTILEQIQQSQIGGVVLYDRDTISESEERNIESPEQLKRLTATLQKEAPKILLVAIDQEGGRVSRLKPTRGFPTSLSSDRLGKLNRSSITRGCSEVCAATLKKAGINLNFAPVVDLDSPQSPIIGQKERSFSDNPHLVVQHAQEVIQSHHRHGILTTLKHFPGMGYATGDTHLGFVDVSDDWSEEELVPFSSLIHSGQADVVMVGHTFNRQIDDEYPASLSQKTIQDLLRNQLKYRGVVISDDLQMEAISANYDLRTAVLQAILAGNDILLFSNQHGSYEEEIAPKVIAMVKEFIEQGLIPRKRIQKSVDRIYALKKRVAKDFYSHS